MDYMDDNADKLARKKMKTDAMKRAFAINGEFQFVHPSALQDRIPRPSSSARHVAQ